MFLINPKILNDEDISQDFFGSFFLYFFSICLLFVGVLFLVRFPIKILHKLDQTHLLIFCLIVVVVVVVVVVVIITE